MRQTSVWKLVSEMNPLYWLNAYDCEVIGNRWDNPELMGGEQNE